MILLANCVDLENNSNCGWAKLKTVKTLLLTLSLTVATILPGFAQGTAFTYQGRLINGGNPANGSYDFTFTIFGTTNGGSPLTQTITNSTVTVNNGLFTSTLDFGNFLTGNPAWLEIGVRSNGNSGFVTLVPRQQLTPTPYAMFANTASNVVGTINGNQITTGSIGAAQIAPGSIGTAQMAAGVSGVLNFQVPATTNVQTAVNTGYVLTNTMMNTITLPASPAVGDRVRVTGGTGGFTLMANPGQSIISPPAFAWNQLTNAGYGNWTGIAMNSDGSKLAAVQNGGYYASTNSGVAWALQANAPTGYTGSSWKGIAMSADGSKLASSYAGYIYISTDSGATWTQLATAPSGNWGGFAMSADGSKLAAAKFGSWDGSEYVPDYIYTSTNSGVTWTQANAGSGNWTGIAMSADGIKLAAVQNGGLYYASTNSGATWAQQTNAPLGTGGIAMSADGSKLAVVNNNGIFISVDSGATWIQQANSMVNNYNFNGGGWLCIAMNADGSRGVAVEGWLNVNNQRYWGYLYQMPNFITQWSTVNVFSASAYACIEVVYVGNGLWMPSFYTGNFTIQ